MDSQVNSNLFKLFQKVELEGMLLHGQSHHDSKTKQNIAKKKITEQHHQWAEMQKSSTKYWKTEFKTHKKEDAWMFQYLQKQTNKNNHPNAVQHINKLKNKNHIIISINNEKATEKFNIHFW